MGKAQDLVFLPLGGAGEIGMNAYLYGIGPRDDRSWLLVDLGITFARDSTPGIDVIFPDLRYLISERSRLAGIVLTHAHEDHYGALAQLWPDLRVPVYATPFTAHLLHGKLIEAGLDGEVTVNTIEPDRRFKVGPFDLELLPVTHSIPEAMALALHTDQGCVFHSGDWKFDPDPVLGPKINEKSIGAIGKAGCLALICDSTNVLREGKALSETEVSKGLGEVIRAAGGRVVITTFASNLGRVIAAAQAGQAAGRTVVAAGRAMWRIIEAGRAVGYMDDCPPIHDIYAIPERPREHLLYLVTGSQGERRAALARIAQDTHAEISLELGDTVVFSSRNIPGNETDIADVQNALSARGIRVVTDTDAPVHTSGHPRRDDLAHLYKLLQPGVIVPMHGEMRHLREHAWFASETTGAKICLARNGQIVRLGPGPAKVVDEAPSGRLLLDGKLLVSDANGPVQVRRKLGFSGFVAASVTCTKKGHLSGDIQLSLQGLPGPDDGGIDFESLLIDVIEHTLEGVAGARADRAELLRRAIRREVHLVWGKKPVVKIFVHYTA